MTPADIEEIFLRLCGYSVYSHMDEIQSGFISAGRSLRVGIGGTAVLKNGALKTVRDVTSLSLRIPREICRFDARLGAHIPSEHMAEKSRVSRAASSPAAGVSAACAARSASRMLFCADSVTCLSFLLHLPEEPHAASEEGSGSVPCASVFAVSTVAVCCAATLRPWQFNA